MRLDDSMPPQSGSHLSQRVRDEQIRALRTLFETREEHLRLLAERVERSDWDVKLEQIRQALQDSNKQRTLEAERLELLSKKVEDQEQVHDDLQRELASHASGKQDAEMAAAVAGLEDQLKTLGLELQELRDHDDLGPRVADLLSQLREIAPKVIEQEKSIRLLQTSEPFQKEIRLLQEEIGTLRSSIASKSSSSTDAVSEKIKEELMKSHAELREQMAASAQVTSQLRELQETTATDLRQQVGELKTRCENAVEKVQTEWKDHLTGLEKSFKQFKAEAHSQEESLQSLQSQLAPLKADGPDEKWLQLQQDVSGELKEHRHRTEESQKELASELYRLVDQSKSEVRTELAKALKAVQGPELELQELLITARKELKGELETLQDLRSNIEAAAAEDSKVAGDQATEFRHIFEQHAAQLKSMEAQLECQKTLKEELDSAKDQVAELQSSTSALNMPSERIEATRTSLNALEHDVAGLKTKLNATPASQESVEELKVVVKGFQDRLESAALKDEVTHLSERVNALIAAQFKKSGGQRQDLEEEFENLAATLQKDEEAESVAHTRLLLRIDELCRNISKATDGGANDWASKFASLAHQVEEMQKAEKQMEACPQRAAREFCVRPGSCVRTRSVEGMLGQVSKESENNERSQGTSERRQPVLIDRIGKTAARREKNEQDQGTSMTPILAERAVASPLSMPPPSTSSAAVQATDFVGEPEFLHQIPKEPVAEDLVTKDSQAQTEPVGPRKLSKSRDQEPPRLQRTQKGMPDPSKRQSSRWAMKDNGLPTVLKDLAQTVSARRHSKETVGQREGQGPRKESPHKEGAQSRHQNPRPQGQGPSGPSRVASADAKDRPLSIFAKRQAGQSPKEEEPAKPKSATPSREERSPDRQQDRQRQDHASSAPAQRGRQSNSPKTSSARRSRSDADTNRDKDLPEVDLFQIPEQLREARRRTSELEAQLAELRQSSLLIWL
ncbi:unnamed protein product [Symbiodinium sp. KB8]|nr:unnamed protein product [Symbiodinium sp. KB8]